MSHLDYLQKMMYLKELIEKGMAESPGILSQRLLVSDRTIKRMITDLRLLGIEIYFDRIANKYMIKNE